MAAGQLPPAHSVSAVAPNAATAPTAQAAPAAQPLASLPVTQPELATGLGRLRAHGSGSHELSIMLHPAELGAVRVHATLHDGTLTVTIACADEASRDAVHSALPSLQQQLRGNDSLDVQLGAQQTGAPTQGQSGDQQRPRLEQNPPWQQLHEKSDLNSNNHDRSGFERRASRERGLDRWA